MINAEVASDSVRRLPSSCGSRRRTSRPHKSTTSSKNVRNSERPSAHHSCGVSAADPPIL
jgi:hypothetical protein